MADADKTVREVRRVPSVETVKSEVELAMMARMGGVRPRLGEE